jgi:hypothetical protein
MRAIRITSAFVLFTCIAGVLSAQGKSSSQYKVTESLDIAEVVSDFRVGFRLLTASSSPVRRQFVAYYDKERRMTVASRNLGSKDWAYQILPTSVGWDSHNYITMAVDREGHLHVSGNMHAVKLISISARKNRGTSRRSKDSQ